MLIFRTQCDPFQLPEPSSKTLKSSPYYTVRNGVKKNQCPCLVERFKMYHMIFLLCVQATLTYHIQINKIKYCFRNESFFCLRSIQDLPNNPSFIESHTASVICVSNSFKLDRLRKIIN